jgi:hypothetical protein
MVQKTTFRIVICVLLLFTDWLVSAQQASGDNHLRTIYDSLFQTSQSLINGKSHQTRYPAGVGHPYFGGFSWTSGIIIKDRVGIPFHAIRYDLLNDDLLIQHFSITGSHVIIVNEDIVESFIIGDHKFYMLESQPGADFDFEPGYYESVYRSNTEIWIRWEKFFSERSSGSGGYEQSRNVIIKNGGQFYKITNRRSILRALQDREDDIKAYLRQHGISVSRASIDQLISLVRYYDNQ